MFTELAKAFAAYDRIILHRHKNPDGDALGSQIGLKHLLLENFPGKEVLMVGDEAGRYSFMEDSVMDQVSDEAFKDALCVILDCSATHLISDDRYTLAPKTLRMDHHLFCGQIAETEVVDTSRESCCGLIAAMAMDLGWKLNPIAAKSLYTGMITDSGRFRYDATNSNTFRCAAFLREQPFDTEAIFRDLYAEDITHLQNKAKFLLKIQLSQGGVAYIYTDKEEVASLNMDTFSISRGMVGTMADLKGVDIWVNFTETDKGVLCELRSNKYNINPIAVKYGGGGHAKASGATVADRQTAMNMLRDLELLREENQ